jgi:uncharacterized protein (DUF924 family)
MLDDDARAVLRFWLEEAGPSGWYEADEALDARIREEFGALHVEAVAGGRGAWLCSAEGSLAFLILVDQFSRNMFRGEGRSFAFDDLARRTAKGAIARGFDRRIEGERRQFFYLPLEHSESLQDQARAVRLIASRMDAPETLLHARAHRDVIRAFGRFPNRNAALGRRSSTGERRFLEEGGYGAAVRRLRAA